MSLLDDLIYGLRDVYKANGEQLPTRSKVQFGRGLSATDNPATGRIEVHAEGDGGDGVATVASLAELRNISSDGLASGTLRLVEETGIIWRYDSAAGANEVDDGQLSVKPAGKAQAEVGRWRPVTLPGLPAWEPIPGMAIPTSYVGASLIALGAKPIVAGAPADAPAFSGFLVDLGDGAGVKRPHLLMELTSDGVVYQTIALATLAMTPVVSIGRAGMTMAPGGRHNIAVLDGQSGHNSTDVSLTISAGNKGEGAGDGDLTLRGGGAGAAITLSGGNAGGDATISAQRDAKISAQHDASVSAQGDAIVRSGETGSSGIFGGGSTGGSVRARGGDSGGRSGDVEVLGGGVSGDVLIEAGDSGGIAFNIRNVGSPLRMSADGIGFFGAPETPRPVVTGSRSDGSFGLSLLNALVALNLVEDQTTP